MNARFARIVLLALVCASLVFPQQKIREQDLPERYRDWLDLASYIILPAEKEVFLRLENDRDRDIFVESFWRQRDPTPETPQNEFKEEHLRRFAYANANLARATPREGWRTDMGRMHIILGPPASIERFDSQPGVHPCQVWYYRGASGKGLPPLFALVFYQRGGHGEYRLYNPAADGPASLLVRPEELDQTNYEVVYKKIRELTPSLAPVVLSVIPGEFPFNFMPSPQNSIILAQIAESPRKDINPRYATDFLQFKGLVTTEYLTNYVESSAVVAVLTDPVLNIDLIHLSFAPKKVSVDYYQPKGQYYCNFKLNATLKKGDRIIYQHEKDFPLYFPPDRKEYIEANGVAVEDVIPVVEGDYDLSLLLQNSVGKEFSYFERRVHVPARSEGAVRMTGAAVGYRLQPAAAEALAPFRVLDRQVSVDSGGLLARTDDLAILFTLSDVPEDLWRSGRARIKIKGLKGEGASEKELSLPLSDQPYKKAMIFSRAVPAAELEPDYYEILMTVVDGQEKILAEAADKVVLSPLDKVSHPVTLVRPTPQARTHFLYYGLAFQYDKISEPDKADALYTRAVAADPGYKPGIIEYARFLIRNGRFERGLAEAERVRDDEELRFQYVLAAGLAYLGKGDFEKAISHLAEGNRIYNSDVTLLNALGTAYYRTGKKKEALEALNASLRLDPQQKEVKALMDRINEESKKTP
jgi:GWxTD domain-containing protein